MTTPPLTQLLTAVLAAALLAGCSSRESRIESGLEKASAFVKVADWDKASVEVRNVLQIEPKTARAHLIAGQVAEGQRDPRRAYGHYLKAVELQPAFPDAQVATARLLLLSGATDRARTTLEPVLAAEPKHVGARTLLAALAAAQGRTAEALAEAQRLVDEVKPIPPEAAMLVAGIHANAGRRGEALAVVDKALADAPKNLALLQVGAQTAASDRGDPAASARAASYFRRAVAEAVKSNDLWRGWAQMHIQRTELDAAEKVLRDAVAADRNNTARQLLLLDFIAAYRGFDAAERAYVAAVAESPREASLRFGLTNLYRSAGRLNDAQRVLAELIDVGEATPEAVAARAELAGYKLATGKLDEARTLVTAVLAANPRDNAALLLRGRIHLIDGNPRDAVVDFRTVSRDQPGSPQVVALLAHAHRSAGEPQLARDAIGEAVKFKPNDADLRLQLAAEWAIAREYAAADTEIDAAIRIDPRLVRAYEVKARVAMARNDRAGAERALQALSAALPGQSVGAVQLGKFYADTRRPELALETYDAAAEQFPNDPVPHIAAVALLTSQRKFDEARARIERRKQAEPRNVLHAQLRGDVAVAAGDLAGAEAAYSAIIAAAPDAAVGYTSLARVKLARSGMPAALEVLERGEAASPADMRIPAARAEYLGRAGKFDEAIAVYEKILDKAPDNDAAANNLAYLLAETRRDAANLTRALALAGRFGGSSNPSYLDSLGYVHYRMGAYDRAVPVLERAREIGPESPLITLHLGQALVKAGDTERGRELLRKAIASESSLPNLDEAKSLLASK